MEHFAGLDVSLEETSIVDSEGRIVVEKRVASQPTSIAEALSSAGFTLKRVGLEAGPLSPWLHAGLCAAGFAVICIETRPREGGLDGDAKQDRSQRRSRHRPDHAHRLVSDGARQGHRKPRVAVSSHQPQDPAA
jgi:hypothetical protein